MRDWQLPARLGGPDKTSVGRLLTVSLEAGKQEIRRGMSAQDRRLRRQQIGAQALKYPGDCSAPGASLHREAPQRRQACSFRSLRAARRCLRSPGSNPIATLASHDFTRQVGPDKRKKKHVQSRCLARTMKNKNVKNKKRLSQVWDHLPFWRSIRRLTWGLYAFSKLKVMRKQLCDVFQTAWRSAISTGQTDAEPKVHSNIDSGKASKRTHPNALLGA
jgi:hypothetical protein